MRSETLTAIHKYCDAAIEALRQVNARPDVALLLFDARTLLNHPSQDDIWDSVKVVRDQEHAHAA